MCVWERVGKEEQHARARAPSAAGRWPPASSMTRLLKPASSVSRSTASSSLRQQRQGRVHNQGRCAASLRRTVMVGPPSPVMAWGQEWAQAKHSLPVAELQRPCCGCLAEVGPHLLEL